MGPPCIAIKFCTFPCSFRFSIKGDWYLISAAVHVTLIAAGGGSLYMFIQRILCRDLVHDKVYPFALRLSSHPWRYLDRNESQAVNSNEAIFSSSCWQSVLCLLSWPSYLDQAFCCLMPLPFRLKEQPPSACHRQQQTHRLFYSAVSFLRFGICLLAIAD